VLAKDIVVLIVAVNEVTRRPQVALSRIDFQNVEESVTIVLCVSFDKEHCSCHTSALHCNKPQEVSHHSFILVLAATVVEHKVQFLHGRIRAYLLLVKTVLQATDNTVGALLSITLKECVLASKQFLRLKRAIDKAEGVRVQWREAVRVTGLFTTE